MNKKGQAWMGVLVVFGVIVAAVVVIALILIGMYNGLVSQDTATGKTWGNVQAAYQRRADLVPNLVATVKAYSDYEGKVLTDITEARASITRATSPEQLQAADAQLTSALSRLLVVVENYPNLKANQNYLDLQAQLEGTENRINTERGYYNDQVQLYQNKVRKFPTNMIAGMFGFSQDKWKTFQANEGAQNAPNVANLFNNS